jgi:Spy/CpxP family protein refolding chaperone
MMGTPADTAKRLDQIKGELGITPAQDNAWKAYAQAVANQSALMSAHRQTMTNGPMPPSPDQQAAMHQEGAAMMQQRVMAAEDLYQVLTPEQQAKANTLLPFRPGSGMSR